MIINAENVNRQFEKLAARTLTNLDDNQISEIGNLAFTSYYSLTTVSFPKCSIIGDWAFYRCSSLAAVYLLSNAIVTLGGSEVFRFTPITSTPFSGYIYVPASLLSQYTIAQYWSDISSRIMPYFNSKDFTTIESIKYIPANYYENNSIFTDYYNSICLTIGEEAFKNCSNLSTILCPSCTIIYDSAFYSCSNLINIYFPSCKTIDDYVFAGCKNLTYAYLPSCVNVRDCAFAECENLTTIILSNCDWMGAQAFNSCTHLTALYLPNTQKVANITSNTFDMTPIVNSNITGQYGSIYVPENYLSLYKTVRYWSDIADRITKL